MTEQRLQYLRGHTRFNAARGVGMPQTMQGYLARNAVVNDIVLFAEPLERKINLACAYRFPVRGKYKVVRVRRVIPYRVCKKLLCGA